MLGSCVTFIFCSNLRLLEGRVSRHAILCIPLGQLEHAVVESVEPCQCHKLEGIAQLAQVSLRRSSMISNIKVEQHTSCVSETIDDRIRSKSQSLGQLLDFCIVEDMPACTAAQNKGSPEGSSLKTSLSK